LVFVAISEALAGQREAAQRDLEAVLADKDTSTPIRDWCQQLLKAPPPALR
jgi:hypothetical protein